MSMQTQAWIFDIKRDCSEDGPGIRTTVFFKGCPLQCQWCQNPEGLPTPHHFHPITEQCAELDNGELIDLQTLLHRVLIDKHFFISSGGGVTVSGGEATLQHDFLHHFLKQLKAEGIHTCLETSGFFNYRRFSEQLLPYLDLIYFDVKIFDDTLSRQFTKQGSSLILQNLKNLSQQSKVTVIPRIPLIPGITTRKDNLVRIAQHLRQLHFSTAVLLPYNPLWQDKLAKLNMHSEYQRKTFMTADELQECQDIFISALNQTSQATNDYHGVQGDHNEQSLPEQPQFPLPKRTREATTQ
ncbi:MAG: radical SAM protein [Gammaproteobacteria bacterium]|nr:radical SAM protein [Gammaproteobacteria bacterium]